MPQSKKSVAEVLDQIIFLYAGYSREHRANTQPFHLEKVRAAIKEYKYDCQDLLVREPLIEHSGSLPIIATAIYPYIEDDSVDLGRALTMLAIHDIGELITGDEITFIKKKSQTGNEQVQALTLLPESLHEIYMEAEGRTSNTARFAKSIDKIVPDIIDLITPAEITIERYKKLIDINACEIMNKIMEFKHPYMTWNSFMTRMHLEILQRLKRKLDAETTEKSKWD